MNQENTQSSLTFKLLIIGGMIILLLIPTIFIQLSISGRKNRQHQVFQEVSSKWGNNQTLLGPVLTVPVQYSRKDKDGNLKFYTRHFYLFPENLHFEGQLDPEIRYMSIYEIPVYSSNIMITGNYNLSVLPQTDLKNGEIQYNDARVSFQISDMKGLGNQVELHWNHQTLPAQAGPHHGSALEKGFHFQSPISEKTGEYSFMLTLDLQGTKLISFIPLGRETTAEFSSSWPHPGFTGDFLPRSRNISSNGFSAEWKIFDLNRNIPPYTDNREIELNEAEFGISLVTPVDQYQQTTRSVKYAVLFFALTFLAFFLIEVLHNQQLHPMQYLLIGSGLVLFYILLLSLSEHLSFSLAYFISSAALIILITLYSKAILRDNRFMGVITAVLMVLYGFLFINLQLEDYALLLGSVGLFLILSLVMYLTRNLNWYRLYTAKEKSLI